MRSGKNEAQDRSQREALQDVEQERSEAVAALSQMASLCPIICGQFWMVVPIIRQL